MERYEVRFEAQGWKCGSGWTYSSELEPCDFDNEEFFNEDILDTLVENADVGEYDFDSDTDTEYTATLYKITEDEEGNEDEEEIRSYSAWESDLMKKRV